MIPGISYSNMRTGKKYSTITVIVMLLVGIVISFVYKTVPIVGAKE